MRLGQALADVATIGLLQERNLRRSETVAEQLQAALNSRVVIEQAKGKLAERLGLDMAQAFSLMRDHARARNLRLADVAQSVIYGSETVTGLTAISSPQRLRRAEQTRQQPRPGPQPGP